MKKFQPMALLLKFEGYPPAVVASLFLHSLLLAFILNRSVNPADYMTLEEPVIITASAIDVNPQRLRRLERLELQRAEDERRRQQAARETREREARVAREREEQARLSREAEEKRRQDELARQRAAEQEGERQRLAEAERARTVEEERLREQQLAQEQAALEASREAQASQLAAENIIVGQYVAIIRRIISQNWKIPPSARNGMVATVLLQLVPTGEVVGSTIIEGSGDAAFDRSVLQAVERADRFPELQDLDNAVFERNFRTFTLVFRPEDLLR